MDLQTPSPRIGSPISQTPPPSIVSEPGGYLRRLYGAFGDTGYISTWVRQTFQVRWYSVADLDELEADMLETARDQDIYHSWFVQREAMPGGKRGGADNAVGSPGIMFDADLKGPAHAETRLPETAEQVREWLSEIDVPAPSQIRHSGNGLYLDWLHPEPVIFGSQEEREAYAQKVRAFHAALTKSARERRGWFFDPVHDLARVTRMPGTQNHKTQPSKPVEMLDD